MNPHLPATPSPDPFRALIDQHARWVPAAAYRQLHDTHLAEDATQTVFILLHQRSQRMQPTPKLKLSGWLFNTLQFTIKNLRREQRRRAAREREIVAQRTTSVPSTETTTDLHDQLDTAVATLSDTDRTAILLRFYQDLPFDQIAATLQITEPAARKRVTRAIGALRKHLNLPPEESAAAGSLTLAATHGLSHAPAALPTTLAATSTAATLPATTAITLKGVTTLMALAKLQTAAIIAAVGLLLLIPATLMVFHRNPAAPPAVPVAESTPPITTALPAATMPALDDSLETFNRLYALAPGQLLKHVPPIDPDLRVTLLSHYGHMGVPRNGYDVIYWRNADVIGTGNLNYPTYPLENLCTQLLHVEFPQIESPLTTAPSPAISPTAPEKGITPDQYIAPFKQILHDDFHLDPTIEFRDVPRKVLVLRGKWNYTPSPDLLPAHSRDTSGSGPSGILPCIDFYSDPATTPHSLRSAVCSGGGDTIASTLAWWLHEDIFNEATGIPDRFATREPRTNGYEDSPFLTPEDRATPSSAASPSKPASPSPKKPAPSTTSSSNPRNKRQPSPFRHSIIRH